MSPDEAVPVDPESSGTNLSFHDSLTSGDTGPGIDSSECTRLFAITLCFLTGSRRDDAVPLAPGDYGIGRAADNEILLSALVDLRVSAHHARLFADQQGWWYEDLDSTNGTLVNGRPLSGPRRLAVGDVVSLGRGVRNPGPGYVEFSVALPDTLAAPDKEGR